VLHTAFRKLRQLRRWVINVSSNFREFKFLEREITLWLMN